MTQSLGKTTLRTVLIAIAGLGLAATAQAQTMTSNSAAYNAGYGRYAGEENQPAQFGIRDANGNLVIVDGQIQTGVDQSSFSFANGAVDSFAGVGASSSSTAIGNSLNVTTQGNYNTVIVTSQQTNTGAITAETH
jgi:holdfast attachment protein HfaA